MSKSPQEWFDQADYDYQAAEHMFSGGRYIYTIFMAHLAVEKALKGIYQRKFKEIPPKTHSLVYFLKKLELHPDEQIGKFLVNLDQASIVTRYPEELAKLHEIYTKKTAKDILDLTKEALVWVKQTS